MPKSKRYSTSSRGSCAALGVVDAAPKIVRCVATLVVFLNAIHCASAPPAKLYATPATRKTQVAEHAQPPSSPQDLAIRYRNGERNFDGIALPEAELRSVT